MARGSEQKTIPSTGSGTVEKVCCPLSVDYKKNASMFPANCKQTLTRFLTVGYWLLAVELLWFNSQWPKALVSINHRLQVW